MLSVSLQCVPSVSNIVLCVKMETDTPVQEDPHNQAYEGHLWDGAGTILPCDNYWPVTISWVCLVLVTISDKHCSFKYQISLSGRFLLHLHFPSTLTDTLSPRVLYACPTACAHMSWLWIRCGGDEEVRAQAFIALPSLPLRPAPFQLA